MGLDALMLARIQFGFTISFHIIFPAITIGLASYLVVLEACWLRTRRPVYRELYHYWMNIFALNFGMGVVSGLVMAYQFGTNWSQFSDFAGGVTGPLLAYEVLTAFFLEAGFLGVMLFGWNRVGPGLHFFATLMVALGTLLSATWILASNSWMHTPAGHEIIGGQVVPVDWLAVIFNPSFPYRLVHMVLAAYLATALIVGGVGAWHLRRGHHTPAVKKMFSMAMWMLLLVAPVQVVVGDFHGLNTLKHQPAKVAAIEGQWEPSVPGQGAPLVLLGWPDMARETTHVLLEVPALSSLILTHSLHGATPGLKEFAPEDRPPALVVFWTFRLMVGLGVLMVIAGVWSGWLRWRGRLYDSPGLLRMAQWLGPAGLLAILAGWYTTEIGRQPWLIQGLMRTSEGVSGHAAAEMGLTLLLFVVVYFLVFGAGVGYVLRFMAAVPKPLVDPSPPREGAPRPSRPMSAARMEDSAGGPAIDEPTGG